MRLAPALSVALVLVTSTPASTQEWIEFVSRDDGFGCNFPGNPSVTATTWMSEHGAALPARIYSTQRDASRYTVTVVDYRDVERILTEKSKSCPAGAETCRGGPGVTGLGYWKIDLQGAPTYARWRLLQRDVRLTHMSFNQMGMVAGEMLQLTNADGSRIFASIYMHRNKLYVLEGMVPAGSPEPGLFQQSLRWFDENGDGPGYSSLYIHGLPDPPQRRTP